MKRKEKIFEEFSRTLEEYGPGTRQDFCDICLGRLGIPPRTLDEILLEELGMDGEEILAEYRRNLRGTIGIGDKNY